MAGELRHRERVLGTTAAALLGLRIRYVPQEEGTPIVKLDDYRDL